MTSLHLVRLPLDLRTFTAWALDRGYMDTPPRDKRGKPRDAEIGYALHAVLAGLLGAQAPRPFTVSPLGQRERRVTGIGSGSRAGVVDVLGYAGVSIDRLRMLAQLAGDELHGVIDWDGASSKPMPERWPKNLRLRFDLRACPVRRIMKPLATATRPNLSAMTLTQGQGSRRLSGCGGPRAGKQRNVSCAGRDLQGVAFGTVRVEAGSAARRSAGSEYGARGSVPVRAPVAPPAGAKRAPFRTVANATGRSLHRFVGSRRPGCLSGAAVERCRPPLRLWLWHAASQTGMSPATEEPHHGACRSPGA